MTQESLLSVTSVAKVCDMGVSTIWAEAKKAIEATNEIERCIAEGKDYKHIKVCFPIPIRYGNRRTRWKRSDIDNYILTGGSYAS